MIDELLEIMDSARRSSCSNLTIGKALQQLKELDEDMVVEIDRTRASGLSPWEYLNKHTMESINREKAGDINVPS